MKNQFRNGISLIILVITVIVVLVLATAIILNITNGSVMDSTKKARFMSDYRSVEDGVTLYSVSNIDTNNTNTFKLPLEGKLSLSDKQDITSNIPTLKTKIEELNPGKTIDDIDLYWINESEAGVNGLASNKKEKGYIIDAKTRQVYDYVGDFFENKRWHTLDGGVTEVAAIPEIQELWDGWIKLTLYYPASSTDRKWRLGSEGETRVDSMLMWQNYKGPITVPLDRTKDIWIKYKLSDKEVTIPPAGTLLVDVIPDSTGTTKVKQVNVNINYDSEAVTKEYRVGNSGWMTYSGSFTVTENCVIEARAKKTEKIYNLDGSLLLSRDIAGSDRVYIGNIGDNEVSEQKPDINLLAAPSITRLDPQNLDEKARVEITYPENAVKKVYKINYGVEQDYTSEVSIKDLGTYVIAYYYDASGNKSISASIYINDISTGDIAEKQAIYTSLPIYDPQKPAIGTDKPDLAAPIITRLDSQNPDEKARVEITYPSNASKKIYTVDNGNEENYANIISVKKWGTYIIAYYYDENGCLSQASWITINDTPTPPEPYPPLTSDPEEIIPAPTININPAEDLVSEVSVSVDYPADADKKYIKIGRYGEYQEYTSPIVLRENIEVYAYYKTSNGKKSIEASNRIKNIVKNSDNPDSIPGSLKPYVYIDANPYPLSGSYGAKDVDITLLYSDADKIEYSEDGIIFKPYTESFKVTENKRIYAKGTNVNGVTETHLDITNIGKLTPPKTIQKLDISINVNPEPSLSTTQVAKAIVNIEYDTRAVEKYYKIGINGDVKEYTGAFEVDSSCTVYAYAKAPDSLGQTSKTIDNIINGISDPQIISSPSKGTQSSKVIINIDYDRNAIIKRYSIDGGELRDYTGDIEVTKNGTKIYAYSQNVKCQSSNSTYIVENIVPPPPVLTLDKGNYYILKLNYPEGSKGREYKWTEGGEWKQYKDAGIILIKPQFKDQLLKDGTLVKIEDENGKLVTFEGDYYLINVPISEMFENIFMRWDRVTPSSPQILLNTTEPVKQVTATIVYDKTLIKKQYRVLNPGGILGEWQDYTGPITVDRNNSIIYAKGIDDSEVGSAEGMYKVTNIDETSPVIKLTADLDTAQQKVAVKVNVTDDVAVGKVKWAQGLQGESYFTNSGTEIINDSIVNITSNGYYTFYAEDKVGNKQLYTLNVSNVDLTAPLIDIQVSPENTVGLNADITINYGDSTTKQYKVGTSNETWTNYTDTFSISSYTILANNWQNTDGTVTIYAKGKDTAGNEITVQKKVVSLDLDKPITPVINSNAGYPILSSKGVTFDNSTTITYDSRTDIDNYYSVDNGITWITYTGTFKVTGGTVIAKSVKKSSKLEVSTSKTIAIASDALQPQAYDCNDGTTASTNGKYIAIDNSVQGQSIRILIKSTLGYAISINYLDENRNCITSISRHNGIFDEVYTIPTNTKWICFGGLGDIGEIQLVNEPTFTFVNGYMLLTADPSKAIRQPYQMVSIKYNPTSVQRLYKIGTTGEWLNYSDQPIRVEQDTTIYAKGIDKDGDETRKISSQTVNVTDALTKESYDNNNSTASYFTGTVPTYTFKYMEIDSSMYGNKIKILNSYYDNWSGTAEYSYISFLDLNKKQISKFDLSNGTTRDVICTVPNGAKYLMYVVGTLNQSTGSMYYGNLYEISVTSIVTFDSIGASYTPYTITQTGKYEITVMGGQGGNGGTASGNVGTNGGKGNLSKGTFSLNKGDVLYVYQGEKGKNGYDVNLYGVSCIGGKGGGGAATEVRLNSDLQSAIIISERGGNGGAGGYYYRGGSTTSLAGNGAPGIGSAWGSGTGTIGGGSSINTGISPQTQTSYNADNGYVKLEFVGQ